jgi:hypothetical protein
MAAHLKSGELPIAYSARFREYGLIYQDGGTSRQLLQYCPWCGSKLPASLRDRWFERLEELGLEPNDPEIPVEMKTDAWWRKTRSRARASTKP